MVPSQIREDLVDEPPDQVPLGVDASNQLGNHLHNFNIETQFKMWRRKKSCLQPVVDFNASEPLVQRVVHVSLVPIVKQECEEPQGILYVV